MLAVHVHVDANAIICVFCVLLRKEQPLLARHDMTPVPRNPEERARTATANSQNFSNQTCSFAKIPHGICRPYRAKKEACTNEGRIADTVLPFCLSLVRRDRLTEGRYVRASLESQQQKSAINPPETESNLLPRDLSTPLQSNVH